MRSHLIFSVSAKFGNRYLLCRMVSMSARIMHRDGASTSQSINRSLQALHDAEGQVKTAPAALEAQPIMEKEAVLLAP